MQTKFLPEIAQLQAQQLANTVCAGPWKDVTLTPLFRLIVMDIDRNFFMQGGAFFTLNMEFFAAMLGLVFSYFVILIQV